MCASAADIGSMFIPEASAEKRSHSPRQKARDG